MRYILRLAPGEEPEFPDPPKYYPFTESVIRALGEETCQNYVFLAVFEYGSGDIDIDLHPDFLSMASETIRLTEKEVWEFIDSRPDLKSEVISYRMRCGNAA